MENIIYFLTKRAILLRRSSVLSLPLHLVFPGLTKNVESGDEESRNLGQDDDQGPECYKTFYDRNLLIFIVS
jgi:hypothetical protein